MMSEASELSRYLFLAGALPFVFLGTAHAVFTPLKANDRKPLSPRDPELIGAMTRAHVLLTRRVDLWSTWIGFNLSHSLGAVLFGVFVLVIGRSAESFAAQAAICVPLATAIATTYVVIGLNYWFNRPNTGIAISLACFLASWATL
jgi:hypothetical protein